MKVNILYDGQYPDYGAASKRIRNYVKGLQLYDAKIEVVSFKLPAGIFYTPLLPWLVLLKLIRGNFKSQIFFVYGFGWISKLFILLFARSKKIKIIFEINEKPYSIVGSSKRDMVLKYFNPFNLFCLTRCVYPLADGFIVISDALHKFALNYSGANAHIIKIPIIVDYDYYQQPTSVHNDLQRPYLIHTAGLNDNKDGITDVFKAVAMVNNAKGIPLHFYITSSIGLPQLKEKINAIIRDNEITEFVHFLGYQEEESLKEYQKGANAVVINKVCSEQNRHNFATKIGEYLALGVPVITTEIGEVSNYLVNNIHCIYVPQNSPIEIAEQIKKILEGRNNLELLKENAKKIAREAFDIKPNAVKVNSFFREIEAK